MFSVVDIFPLAGLLADRSRCLASLPLCCARPPVAMRRDTPPRCDVCLYGAMPLRCDVFAARSPSASNVTLVAVRTQAQRRDPVQSGMISARIVIARVPFSSMPQRPPPQSRHGCSSLALFPSVEPLLTQENGSSRTAVRVQCGGVGNGQGGRHGGQGCQERRTRPIKQRQTSWADRGKAGPCRSRHACRTLNMRSEGSAELSEMGKFG